MTRSHTWLFERAVRIVVLGFAVGCYGNSGSATDTSAARRDSLGARSGALVDTTTTSGHPTFKTPDPAHVRLLSNRYSFVEPLHASKVKRGVSIKKKNNHGVLSGQEPDMTLARAILTGEPTIDEAIVGLIESKGPYDGLGIRTGKNYVYRHVSSSGGPWEVWIVPDDGTTPTQLEGDTYEYSDHPPGRARLVQENFKKRFRPFTNMVAFGVCIDDQSCGTGHCGYSQ